VGCTRKREAQCQKLLEVLVIVLQDYQELLFRSYGHPDQAALAGVADPMIETPLLRHS
jgi:hypothetical protein